MTVVVFGGLNMDLIVEAREIAAPGETREGDRFLTTPGGKGGNQAVAAARILEGRAAVEMVGLVGDDRYGEELRRYLEAAGVGVGGVGIAPDATSGVAVIMIDGRGENSVNAVYGANLAVNEATAELLRAAAPSVLLVQQELPRAATLAAMRVARELGATVILDPAPSRDDGASLFALATIVTPNQPEARDLTGIEVVDPDSARGAARAVRDRGVPTAIVTLGELGVWVESAEHSTLVAAPPVEAVATVGAGDAFNGALAAGLVLGLDLVEAARLGVAAASLSVTRPGAQESMPARAEVEAMLARMGERGD
jgi:ribokinase